MKFLPIGERNIGFSAAAEQLAQFRQRVQAGQLGHATLLMRADVLPGT